MHNQTWAYIFQQDFMKNIGKINRDILALKHWEDLWDQSLISNNLVVNIYTTKRMLQSHISLQWSWWKINMDWRWILSYYREQVINIWVSHEQAQE